MIIHELLCNDCFLNFHNIIIFLKKENRFKNKLHNSWDWGRNIVSWLDLFIYLCQLDKSQSHLGNREKNLPSDWPVCKLGAFS